VDFIHQHHGTTLVEYFYREAVRLQENNGAARLSWNRPFAIRAPSRKAEKTAWSCWPTRRRVPAGPERAFPNSIRKLVHDLAMKRLLDGQFEESGLTLTELHIVEESCAKASSRFTTLGSNTLRIPCNPSPKRARFPERLSP